MIGTPPPGLRALLFATFALACGCPIDEPTPPGPTDPIQPDAPCAPPDGERILDELGGDTRVTWEATGFFRTQEECGRWWLVTPDGHPFWSAGVNHISPDGDAAQDSGRRRYREAVNAGYPSLDAWADATAERMRSWGFNTVGAWSRLDLLAPRMPYTVMLSLSGGNWETGALADWFDPRWEEELRARVAAEVEPRRDDPLLVGYFVDNEIRWGRDWRGTDSLLQEYLALPAEAPGKRRAVEHLLDSFDDLAGLNAALSTDFEEVDQLLAHRENIAALDPGAGGEEESLTRGFLALAAEHYFGTAAAAIREVDEHHLLLGNREVASMARAEVLDAAARHCDVVSLNNYRFLDGVAEAASAITRAMDVGWMLEDAHERTGRPILVSEYGFRAADSGLPNTWPPFYPTLDDQAARADAFEAENRAAQESPWVVGMHWFEWVDQPPRGGSTARTTTGAW